MINYGTLCTQYLDAYWDVGWQWVFYSWVAAVILVTWYFTITFRILILLLTNTEDTWWGGGWRWWVSLGGCRDTCDGEREQPPLPTVPVPLEAAHKPHMSQSAASSTKRLLGARSDQECKRLFLLQWGGGVDSFKRLGRSDRGRVVGHTTTYPIQLAPVSKTSDCESLQVVILKVNQRLLLWSEEACVS